MDLSVSATDKVILVPVNGTVCDRRALDLALLLARRDRAAVSAIYVVVVPQELPLEAEVRETVARGDQVLRDIEAYAIAAGQDIEIELLQARAAGPAIVDEATGRNASAIVMATSVWRRAGEVTIGRTTVPYVLKNAPCEVIVCRRPAGAR